MNIQRKMLTLCNDSTITNRSCLNLLLLLTIAVLDNNFFGYTRYSQLNRNKRLNFNNERSGNNTGID